MTGFLPAWLAVPGVLTAGSVALATIAAHRPAPGWLLPLSALLALGTWH